MAISLTDIEEQALDAYLPELRYEIARIKRERTRRDLVELEQTLTALRRRLGDAGPQQKEAGPGREAASPS